MKKRKKKVVVPVVTEPTRVTVYEIDRKLLTDTVAANMQRLTSRYLSGLMELLNTDDVLLQNCSQNSRVNSFVAKIAAHNLEMVTRSRAFANAQKVRT